MQCPPIRGYGYNGRHGFQSRRRHCFRRRNMDAFFASIPPRTPSKRSPLPRPSLVNSIPNGASLRSVDHRNGFPENLSRNSSSKWKSDPIRYSKLSGTVKPPTIERNLECTLEELCYGCMKKVMITRDVLTLSGQIIQEDEILSVKVNPGWKKGTKVTFEGMGNESPGAYAADVTFVIAEKRHSLFRRVGDDLELTVEIPLVKALTGCSFPIPLLGGGTMNLEIDEIIGPGYQRVIKGQGMANKKEPGSRGNLNISFLVNFPKDLTNEQRTAAVSVLGDSG
ncbi:hypothetical protein Golax_008527 [Gossypium laxum]|uniref:Chaperone DnaJ C-terminal domain-containing protein n=1 Tax=Gossypium laxum TaxID=34288 RepID=A0A7J9AAR0_9ROSI|nr:hypothetical protein [Gossypium laxum]